MTSQKTEHKQDDTGLAYWCVLEDSEKPFGNKSLIIVLTSHSVPEVILQA